MRYRFADDAIGFRRWRIFRVGIARNFARVREGSAIRRQEEPHVLEADGERGWGATETADGGDNPFKADGKDEEVVGQSTQGSEE